MTNDQLEGFATEVALVIKAALAPLQERIAVLEARAQRLEAMEEARLAGLDAKPHVKFCGVWKAGGAYAPGDAATHHGGLWICKAATTGEPGKDFSCWQLAVKRGAAS